ncbi:3-mercaptopyruvate sulfurtransferase [Xanthobacteraceae bacterium Astr-EGSB]|uniref:3-mercaptopyruvate sulfurtransferase n=1 Tax=Astrobacterium formosum TaxID=3069710 RepID=UPI0027B4D15D|nr:3-mercaptopyruvate sulfurtransferase [Xanthobacteraceae bacterium Astr-EGSB]
MKSRSTIFVDTKWLAGRLGTPGLAIVDGSFFIPGQGRDAEQEYNLAHIPGAVRFDVDAICDRSNPLPHMLPSAEEFAAAVGALGISEHDTIVVYDVLGLFSAPRVWWTFRLFGAEKVMILDGGLPKWQAEGRPVESGPAKPTPKRFAAKPPRDQVATAASVAHAAANGTAQVVDARSPGRFCGDEPEPRPGLSSGHIPGSRNVPVSALVADGHLLPDEQLKKLMADSGVDLDRPVITSCGSGVSAAVVWLALEVLGKPPVALYDGSWSEWASLPGQPIAKGPA